MNINQQKLTIYSTTRWNRTLYYDAANRWPVFAVLSDATVTKRYDRTLVLKAHQWVLLEELAKLLEPFTRSTKCFLLY